jgi:hypothetical protein
MLAAGFWRSGSGGPVRCGQAIYLPEVPMLCLAEAPVQSSGWRLNHELAARFAGEREEPRV